MLRIVAPNLFMANVTVCPIIRMHVNMRIKYVGYLVTNLSTTGVECCVDYVRVRQVHSLGHAGLPPAPTLLLVDDDDSCSDYFDSPR
jgi:hypothetical protein